VAGSPGLGGSGGEGGGGVAINGPGAGPQGDSGDSGGAGQAGTDGAAGKGAAGGFGAGDGGTAGGGGLGAGGDIFVAQGGTLTIDGGTLANGTVAGGLGANDGNPGDYNYGSGIFLQGNETITLAATASTPLTVSGVIADQTSAGGTGVNAGAGKLAIGGTGTVTLDADNTFVGGVDIKSGVLDLAHSGAAGAGPISFVSSNSDPTLEFSPSSEPGVPIENFGPDDQILITGFAATDESYSGGALRLDGVGGPVDLVLSGPGLTSVVDFSFSVDSQSDTTTIETAPCYCRGTLIRTELGERPVEDLAVGDDVMIRSGALRPIKWIGQRKVAARFADPLRAWPVRIKAHALAEGVPARDLLLSPDHAILVDDVLVQAGALVNNTSIVRETELPETFTYYHIELDEHSLILAENTPAETFIDNVDRLGFDNWQEHEALYPQGRAMAEMSYPRAKAHRQVPRGIRERLSARTIALFGKNSVAA
jgi:autotransporter-associated beta strand protein